VTAGNSCCLVSMPGSSPGADAAPTHRTGKRAESCVRQKDCHLRAPSTHCSNPWALGHGTATCVTPGVMTCSGSGSATCCRPVSLTCCWPRSIKVETVGENEKSFTKVGACDGGYHMGFQPDSDCRTGLKLRMRRANRLLFSSHRTFRTEERDKSLACELHRECSTSTNDCDSRRRRGGSALLPCPSVRQLPAILCALLLLAAVGGAAAGDGFCDPLLCLCDVRAANCSYRGFLAVPSGLPSKLLTLGRINVQTKFWRQ
jgi:hypothetical protein